MKRQRKSTRRSTETKNMDEQDQAHSICETDLPSTILVEIFLKLPTVSIVMCKSVSKTWRDVISDQEFVKMHLALAKTCTLIRNTHHLKISRSLYILEDDEFKSGYCWCIDVYEKCKTCRPSNKVPLKARVKLPLRNARDLLGKLNDSSDENTMFCIGTISKRKNLIMLSSYYDYRYQVSNSCNGLLCLFSADITEPVMVCNPVTGEFVCLPNSCYAQEHRYRMIQVVGFGFSTEHNVYKVIMMSDYALEIHTLGTKSWRKLEFNHWENNIGTSRFPTYFEGALHWIHNEGFVSLDLNEERFQSRNFPHYLDHSGLRVLGGRLYAYTTKTDSDVIIWVMNEHEAWTELFSIRVSEFQGKEEWQFSCRNYESLFLCSINNETVVMFDGGLNEFLHYDHSEGLKFKQLQYRGRKSDCEAIAFTPSFISLKDIGIPSDVEVRNVNSRCGKLKLDEENYPHLLGGPRRSQEHLW